MTTFTRSLTRAVLLCLPAALAGCATPYHYSQLVGSRYFRVPIDTYPTAVVRVDDESTPLRGGPVLVEPGLRRIVLSASSVSRSAGEQRVLELQVAPCTRYYLVAEKSTRLATDFRPRVDFQEPVPGCTVRPG